MFALRPNSLFPVVFSIALACKGEVGDEGSDDVASESSTGDTDTDTGDTDTGDTDTGVDPLACWTDLGFGEHEVLYQGFAGGSEGIAFGLDGLLYATANDRVWQVTAEGTASEFAMVPDALGLAARPDGSLVVASFGMANQPDGSVWTVDDQGAAMQIAAGIDSPNFVTIALDGSALISDDFDTRVFRIDEQGQVSVVIASVPSPNGMAYSPNRDFFYVASTFTPLGQLTRYEVGDDGMPIEASAVEILQLGMASTPDGIAVDEEGWVYVAANLRGEIWRVDGSVAGLDPGELVAEGLGFPASIAFGQGPGFDPCSLYLTQLENDTLQRVFVGRRGVPLPPPIVPNANPTPLPR